MTHTHTHQCRANFPIPMLIFLHLVISHSFQFSISISRSSNFLWKTNNSKSIWNTFVSMAKRKIKLLLPDGCHKDDIWAEICGRWRNVTKTYVRKIQLKLNVNTHWTRSPYKSQTMMKCDDARNEREQKTHEKRTLKCIAIDWINLLRAVTVQNLMFHKLWFQCIIRWPFLPNLSSISVFQNVLTN